MHLAVPILLIIDGDSVPTCLARVLVFIECVGNSIQGDRLEEQAIVGRPLYLNDQMIPGIVLGRAWNARGNPLLVHVVVNVPLMSTGDATFVAPNEALAEFTSHELVDIEFECLSVRQTGGVEIHIVDEIVSAIGEGMAVIGKTLA